MAALIELLVQMWLSRWTCGAHPNDKALGFGGPVAHPGDKGVNAEHRSLRRSSQVQNDWCDARMTRDGAIDGGRRPSPRSCRADESRSCHGQMLISQVMDRDGLHGGRRCPGALCAG